jgi:BlaI family transcriptional regulator, penicillinase repressor
MTHKLTELQLAIMDVLWAAGEASVADVHDALRRQRRVVQSTVATLLARLTERGVVTHREDGRQYLYRAKITRDEVRRTVVSDFAGLTRRLFEGDVAELVNALLREQDVAPEDLERIRSMIEERQKGAGTEEPR